MLLWKITWCGKMLTRMKCELSNNQDEIHKLPGWHVQRNDKATGQTFNRSWFSSWWSKIGLFSKISPLTLGPPNFLFAGYWGADSPGVKWPEHEADHTPPQCALMTCKGTTLFYQICKMDNTDGNKSIKCITMLSSDIIIACVQLEHVTEMDITRLIANGLKLQKFWLQVTYYFSTN